MNWKRFAIEFAELFYKENNLKSNKYYTNFLIFIIKYIPFLKKIISIKSINKIFNHMVNLNFKIYSNPGFENINNYLIYSRILTIVESDLSKEHKIQIFISTIEKIFKNKDYINLLKGFLTNSEKKEASNQKIIEYIKKDYLLEDINVLIKMYLPIVYLGGYNSSDVETAKQNNEFKEFILNSYISNKISSNHQFAFISYYMLFITYLYKVIRVLKFIGNSDIIENIDSFIKNKLGNDLNIIFELSGIGEDEFCRNVNNFIRCLHVNEIQEIQNFVQKRNHCAHPSGIIQYTSSEIDNLISKMDIYTKKIQGKINNYLLNYIKNNLGKINFNEKLILSEKEILFLLDKQDKILNFDSSNENNIQKKLNFIKLIYNEYTEYIDFKEGIILKLYLELFKGYNKRIPLYYKIITIPQIIKSFNNNEKNNLIGKIKDISLENGNEEDGMDEDNCIGFIKSI